MLSPYQPKHYSQDAYTFDSSNGDMLTQILEQKHQLSDASEIMAQRLDVPIGKIALQQPRRDVLKKLPETPRAQEQPAPENSPQPRVEARKISQQTPWQA